MYYRVSSSPIGCNLLTIIILVVLIVSFPGILWLLIPIALVILIPIALVAFRFAKAMWKVKRAYKQAYKQAYNNTTSTHSHKESKAQPGDIKITLNMYVIVNNAVKYVTANGYSDTAETYKYSDIQ